MSNIIKELPIECLIPDPLNDEAFDLGNMDYLESSIKEEGMLGSITAYPCGNDKYMIESGHRRYYACVKAGLSHVSVIISEPPDDILDRRRRLVRWNLHNRPQTPIGMAKLAQFLFETYETENARHKEMGEATVPILERIAQDMECSKANVSKYRMLLSLSPELQTLVANGTCSWAPMSAASQLTQKQQEALYRRIHGRLLLGEEITGKWLEEEIKEFRYLITDDRTVRSYEFDRNDTSLYSEELTQKLKNKNKKRRRASGDKAVESALAALKSLNEGDMVVKDAEKLRKQLKDLKFLIDIYLTNENE